MADDSFGLKGDVKVSKVPKNALNVRLMSLASDAKSGAKRCQIRRALTGIKLNLLEQFYPADNDWQAMVWLRTWQIWERALSALPTIRT